jgi:hypothetical protein
MGLSFEKKSALTGGYAYRMAGFDRLSCLTIGNKRSSEETFMLIGVPAEPSVGETCVVVTPGTENEFVAQDHAVMRLTGVGVAAS